MQAELLVAGIAAERIISIRSGGPLATLDWASSPTGPEQTLAAQVLAAHDPDIEAKEKVQAVLDAKARRAALLADWQAIAPGPLRRALGVLLALHDDAWKEAKP